MDLPPHLRANLAQWNEGNGISALDWICCVGSYDQFIGYSKLFWPDFSELEGRVFLSDLLDGRQHEMQNTAPEQKPGMQAMINTLDVTSLFGGLFGPEGDAVSDETLYFVAEMLRGCWAAKLKQDLPDTDARVFIEDNLDEEGVGELVVSIVQP